MPHRTIRHFHPVEIDTRRQRRHIHGHRSLSPFTQTAFHHPVALQVEEIQTLHFRSQRTEPYLTIRPDRIRVNLHLSQAVMPGIRNILVLHIPVQNGRKHIRAAYHMLEGSLFRNRIERYIRPRLESKTRINRHADIRRIPPVIRTGP